MPVLEYFSPALGTPLQPFFEWLFELDERLSRFITCLELDETSLSPPGIPFDALALHSFLHHNKVSLGSLKV